jgi:hypothetical protein
MPMTSPLVAAILTVASFGVTADVNDTSEARRLSIPVSSVGVSIPREDWTLDREQRREGDTAVYYLLSSRGRQLIFSVYIDKTDVCTSAEACLEAALKNTAYRDARNMEKAEQGHFQFAKFHLDKPKGAPIRQAHVLASAYIDGVWIDIHISKEGKERPDLAPLLDFLSVITLK